MTVSDNNYKEVFKLQLPGGNFRKLVVMGPMLGLMWSRQGMT